MADLADVRDTFVAILTAGIYPTGTENLSAISLDGCPVDVAVFAGWPLKENLQRDLAAKTANVSVFPQPGSERNTSRFPREWEALTQAEPTLTATAAATTVTLGGTVSTPQNLAIRTGGKVALYAVQAGDTLTSIAAALATLVSAITTATSSGPVITIPGADGLTAHVGAAGSMIRELRRQERLFQITVWCSTPEQRDIVARFVDGVLIGVGLENGREFMALPDGSAGRLLYVRSPDIDRDQLSNVFRRDILYSAEFATTETADAFQIVTVATVITPDLADASLPTLTINL